MENKSFLTQFTKALMYILTIIFLVIDIIYLYYVVLGHMDKTVISSAFTNTQEDPITGEKYSVFDVNYYSNNQNSDKAYEVVELKINCFSESTYQTILPRGIQMVITKDSNGKEVYSLYYYQVDHGIGFIPASVSYENYVFPIKIQDELYGIRVGTIKRWNTKPTFKGWFRQLNVFSLSNVTSMFVYKQNASYSGVSNEYYKVTNSYTENISFNDIMLYIRTLAKSQSKGYGDTYISAIDFSRYFELVKYENGAYTPLNNSSSVDKITQDMFYYDANIHYDYRGLTNSKQSLFGSVKGNGQFNSNPGIVSDYWKVLVNYKLDNSNYSLRKTDNGYYISLSEISLKQLNNYNCDFIYDVFIDLDTFKEEVIGIDYFGFANLEIKNLTIVSKSERRFTLLDNSLNGSNVQNFTCSDNIDLTIDENAYQGGTLV